jgi:NAD(P)-dependent dehydrogenase (short-subunit alcohol dehydrogenase family)
MHPFGRLGLPDDLATAALFLATEEAPFIVGPPLIVNGGMTVNS